MTGRPAERTSAPPASSDPVQGQRQDGSASTRTPQPRPGSTPTDVLRTRLNEGMAFIPAKLVRALLAEYDAAREELADLTPEVDALSAQARVAEFRRIEAERTLRDTASELVRIVGEINSQPETGQ